MKTRRPCPTCQRLGELAWRAPLTFMNGFPFKNSDEEEKALSKNAMKLERNIGALRVPCSFVRVLVCGCLTFPLGGQPVDHLFHRRGWEHIFSKCHHPGFSRGRQAATLLTKGLTDHLASIDPSDGRCRGAVRRGSLYTATKVAS
ncbi:hypothetical protein B0H21DRAFT_378638 [Amylocystis lapponica]|nr:hypothetical protein B0H21DRAFT_378638 [Amylocystis lapponica]